MQALELYGPSVYKVKVLCWPYFERLIIYFYFFIPRIRLQGALGLGAPPPCPTVRDPGGNRVSGSSSGGLWTAGEGKVESKGTTFFSLYCTASGGSRARWQQFCGS